MKFFHLSDLHIGKQLHGYNLYESQRAVLHQIVEAARAERPDAILIAGDVFDKSVPSGEAYALFDEFLNALADLQPNIPTMIIAGNHDSPERLRYASSFLARHQIYIAAMPPENEGQRLTKVTLNDAFGAVDFYLLPFTKPEFIRHLAEEPLNTYEQAVKWLLDREELVEANRNVLLSHQFYVSGTVQPQTCDSEQLRLSIGGLDQVDAALLGGFDYAALGHLHGAQKVGTAKVRYCGTPLKYSVSEEHHVKSITIVTLGEPGTEPLIETLMLTPLYDVRTVRGELEQIIAAQSGKGVEADYVSIMLTDELEHYNARERLQECFSHILEIRADNSRMQDHAMDEGEFGEDWKLDEAFAHFYEEMHGRPMQDEALAVMEEVYKEVAGGDCL